MRLGLLEELALIACFMRSRRSCPGRGAWASPPSRIQVGPFSSPGRTLSKGQPCLRTLSCSLTDAQWPVSGRRL